MAFPAAPPELKIIIVELFERHRLAGMSAPTVDQVRRNIGKSMSTAYRMMTELVEDGVIPKLRSAGGAHPYRKKLKMTPEAVRQRASRLAKRKKPVSQEVLTGLEDAQVNVTQGGLPS